MSAQVLPKLWKRYMKFYKRYADALLDGSFDCAVCERLTNNGRCWECMHGKHPLQLMKKELEAVKAERDEALAKLNAMP